MNDSLPPPMPTSAPPPAPFTAPAPPLYQAAASKPTSTAAIVSLIAGLLSWILLPLIAAIVAIVAGHMARSEIRQSNGSLDGDGLAIAGLILGYIQIALLVLLIIVLVLFFGGLAAFVAASQ